MLNSNCLFFILNCKIFAFLLGISIVAPVQKGIRHADHVARSIRKKLALTSLTSGGSSVGIVRLRTEAMEFFYLFVIIDYIYVT
jgi:hypothetical protein